MQATSLYPGCQKLRGDIHKWVGGKEGKKNVKYYNWGTLFHYENWFQDKQGYQTENIKNVDEAIETDEMVERDDKFYNNNEGTF